MASPAKIVQALPDTLPEDFSEWDGGNSPAAPPASSPALRAGTDHVAAQKAAPPPPKSQIKVVAVMDGSTIAPLFNAATFNAAQDVLAESTLKARRRVLRKRMMMTAVAATLTLILLALCPWVFPSLLPGLSKVKQSVVSMGKGKDTDSSSNKLKPSPATLLTKAPQPVANAAAQPPSAQQNTAVNQTTDSEDSTPAPVGSKMMDDQLSAPKRIPQDIKTVAKTEVPPSSGFAGTGLDGLANTGANLGHVFANGSKSKVNIEGPSRVNLSSGVTSGMLIRKTTPVYPAIAKTARVSGTVVLQATIDKSGVLENIRVASGPAMLQQSALDAVKSWRYKPYMLDGKPVEVDTTLNVVFNNQ
ncbi:MAG: TonB family protein [Terracidiphilus sp.]|jgi:TonB family protein